MGMHIFFAPMVVVLSFIFVAQINLDTSYAYIVFFFSGRSTCGMDNMTPRYLTRKFPVACKLLQYTP